MRKLRTTSAAVVIAAVVVALTAAPGSAVATWSAVATVNPGAPHKELDAVAALSSSEAWAAGLYQDSGNNLTLIEQRDGLQWKQIASQDPGGPPDSGHDDNYLFDVAVTSSTNAWAVGNYNNGSSYRTLIERWDGSAWKVQASPNPAGLTEYNELRGVVALSSSDAWAVGSRYDGVRERTLIVRWNGSTWKKVKSPSPPGSSYLESVTATSSTNAWAVGHVDSKSLILHWDGLSWTRQKSPSPSVDYNYLNGVDATSDADAWAIGYDAEASHEVTFVLHWAGRAGSAWRARARPRRTTTNSPTWSRFLPPALGRWV